MNKITFEEPKPKEPVALDSLFKGQCFRQTDSHSGRDRVFMVTSPEGQPYLMRAVDLKNGALYSFAHPGQLVEQVKIKITATLATA
jgi:hypothetical protein